MQIGSLLDYETLRVPIQIGVTLLLVLTTWLLFSSYRERVHLRDAHVLITGGSSGIGLCLARLALAEGAKVSIVARNQSRLDAAKEQLSALPLKGIRVEVYSCDCTDADAVGECFDVAEKALGPVDLLIGSAGGAQGGYFQDLTPASFEAGLRGNYVSQLYPAHTAFRRMVERKRGHICLVGSLASLLGVFGYSTYAPAKFAVRGLAEVLYYEGEPHGVGVTLALPPDTNTPGYREEIKDMPPESRAISADGGLFEAEVVAKKILKGIKRGAYRVTVGMDGALLGMVTAGMTPGISFLEVVLMPILRVASAFYVANWLSTIRRVQTNPQSSNVRQ